MDAQPDRRDRILDVQGFPGRREILESTEDSDGAIFRTRWRSPRRGSSRRTCTRARRSATRWCRERCMCSKVTGGRSSPQASRTRSPRDHARLPGEGSCGSDQRARARHAIRGLLPALPPAEGRMGRPDAASNVSRRGAPGYAPGRLRARVHRGSTSHRQRSVSWLGSAVSWDTSCRTDVGPSPLAAFHRTVHGAVATRASAPIAA